MNSDSHELYYFKYGLKMLKKKLNRKACGANSPQRII